MKKGKTEEKKEGRNYWRKERKDRKEIKGGSKKVRGREED